LVFSYFRILRICDQINERCSRIWKRKVFVLSAIDDMYTALSIVSCNYINKILLSNVFLNIGTQVGRLECKTYTYANITEVCGGTLYNIM